MDVARWNVLNSARAGLTSMEHWYGLPEALFTDKTIQNYPLNYNYANEQNRFEEAGKLWKQAAPPYSEHWNKVMNELLVLILHWTRLLIFMKPTVTCKGQEEQSGMKGIHCHRYGNFMNPAV